MLVSILIVLIIPKFIGVYEYGLWQVFVFYISYVGILHLGWADGLFLRRGGQKSNEVNIASLKAETVLYTSYNFIISSIIVCSSFFFFKNYFFIVFALGIATIVVNIRTWITMILQSFENFHGYAINMILQSIVYFILIIVILVFNLRDYRFMLIAFIFSQLVTCISGFIQINKQFKFKSYKFDFKDSVIETKKNIFSGFKLMISNLTALLIVGVIRFGIQQNWSVSVFGKVSLVLSVANLIAVFINAVSLVLFPTLRRTNQNVEDVYMSVRDILMPFLYISMIVYFPITFLLPIWLPKYIGALRFVSVLIPMMIFQGKFEILSNTFMKNLRMETDLMRVNVLTLLFSIILSVITTYIMHSLHWAVFSIALVMGVRSIISDVLLTRKINVSYMMDLLFENIFVFGFMTITWNSSLMFSFFIYCIFILLYLWIKRKSIKSGIPVIKELSHY